MIGASKPFLDIKLALARIAASNCTVLITGETGTGKELAAEFVHANSARRDRPFVCINCAAIPESLIESELFGHSRGAFTGADATYDGLLTAANGGTVFLDEIGDMSLTAQAKILRVIEKKEVCRVGATRPTKLDIRFVTATNQNLEAKGGDGSFRRDLFFRLSVAHVRLPALRERKEDLPLLVKHYSREFRPAPHVKPIEFSEASLRLLLAYDWPGNVRELKNLVEAMSIAEVAGPIEPAHLPERLQPAEKKCAVEKAEIAERESLISALTEEGGNKAAAARRLNWSRMTLYRKLTKHQIFMDGGARLEPAS
ncbi:MAG TPA: sigma-54 dependent transcriptional regulator [Terracidiphilus sp.]|jgi:DNA-binding NtrC family response regulator|nr:sigma-54 dependent transcriptional regulator [Terracidiphilus sp.]